MNGACQLRIFRTIPTGWVWVVEMPDGHPFAIGPEGERTFETVAADMPNAMRWLAEAEAARLRDEDGPSGPGDKGP